jgi:hypothetical protein
LLTLPSFAEEMLQDTLVQWVKGGSPTIGLPSSKLVISVRALNIIFKPHCRDSRMANLTANYGKKTVK